MGFLPRYTHIVNRKIKHTYLSFDEEGNLIIKSPVVSQNYIEKLLLKKANWINRSREKILNKKGRALDFNKEAELLFMGKAYPITLQQQTKNRTTLILEDHTYFLLHYHHYDETLFQKKIDHFYKEEAKKQIPPLVERWAKKMALYPNKISFRKTKRQWGSCSSRNDLSFNTMMMKLPPTLIEYIIVHELAHIQYKHHQKKFWACIEAYLPHYKSLIQELKTYTTH
jgi:predicted metal-dependent hydrolase